MPVDEDDPMYEGDDWSPDFHVLSGALAEVEPVLEVEFANQQIHTWFVQEAVAMILCSDPEDPQTCQRVADWARRPEHRPGVDLGHVIAGLASLVAAMLPQDGAERWVQDLPQVRKNAQSSVDRVVKAGLEIAELNDMIEAVP
jgi:hypothetical protein